MYEPSDEVLEHQVVEEEFKAQVSAELFSILEDTLGRSQDAQAFVAALMLRYGLVLNDSAGD